MTRTEYQLEDKGPMLLALWWTEAGIATVIVGLRLYTRFLMRGLVLEDWLMLLALILFYLALACSSVLVHYGLGRHEATLTAHELREVAKWDWIPQPFSIMNLAVVKLSISCLLLRLFQHVGVPHARGARWFLVVNMGLFTATMVVASILTFVQCDPPRALWEEVPGAHCWDSSVQAGFATFGGAYSAFMDFALALLPMGLLRGLTMSTKRKISLAVLLGAGVLSGVFGIVKTTLSNTLALREDVSWQLVPLYGWAGSEVFLNIVCGSLPTLKPLYERVVHKKPFRVDGQEKYYQHYGTDHSHNTEHLSNSRSRNVATRYNLKKKYFGGGGEGRRDMKGVEERNGNTITATTTIDIDMDLMGRDTSVVALTEVHGNTGPSNYYGSQPVYVPEGNHIGMAQSYGYYYNNMPGDNAV